MINCKLNDHCRIIKFSGNTEIILLCMSWKVLIQDIIWLDVSRDDLSFVYSGFMTDFQCRTDIVAKLYHIFFCNWRNLSKMLLQGSEVLHPDGEIIGNGTFFLTQSRILYADNICTPP